ncbi:DUF3806 domain-containing protein [Myroides odoratimimus]|uniref:DUF3806 domain-containing protein n=1 Tax=Myroides odoratimimus CIP 101113 TaxID=883154 RepID=A0AAV3F6T4_9FLAO|nr:DUF3806 domain-containing protein [Myroides odoratimimus]EHO14827.1 hypothetical protein HMPREF9715_00712 [Myroides odoratimimus CIP 101113]MEC4053464.1 DUF3806 domain-containing protein [Myroides odoratimimus]
MQYIDLGVEKLVLVIPDEYDVELADYGGFILTKDGVSYLPYISVYDIRTVGGEDFDFEQVLEDFTTEASHIEEEVKEVGDKFYYMTELEIEDLYIYEYSVLYNNVRFELQLFISQSDVNSELARGYLEEAVQMIEYVGIVLNEDHSSQALAPEELEFIESSVSTLLGANQYELKSVFDSGKALDILQWLFDEQCFDLKDKEYLGKLGLLFGALLRYYYIDFEWVGVEGDLGYEYALQYKDTEVVIFPISLVVSRLEAGEHIQIPRLLDKIFQSVEDQFEEE